MSEWLSEAWPDYAGEKLNLAPGDVHVWRLMPESDFAQFLPPHERLRYDGITHEENKSGYAMSQGGLRRIASFYMDRDWRDIQVLRRSLGKPYIDAGPEFNLSHTVGQVFAAFALHDVGLDIESVDRKVHALELSRKFFSPAEAADIAAQPEDQRDARFLRYWVCKEATVKLSGDGIYRGLRDVEISLGGSGWSQGIYRGRPVKIREFRLSHELMGALASWQTFSVKGFFRV